MTRFLSSAICDQCGHGHRNNWKCHGVVCNPLQKRRSVTASDVLIEVLVSKLAKTLRSCRTHHSHNLREDIFLSPSFRTNGLGHRFRVAPPVWKLTWDSSISVAPLQIMFQNNSPESTPKHFVYEPSQTFHRTHRLPHTEAQRSTRGQKNNAPTRSAPDMRACVRACVTARHRASSCAA